jgi:hypothetical protein
VPVAVPRGLPARMSSAPSALSRLSPPATCRATPGRLRTPRTAFRPMHPATRSGPQSRALSGVNPEASRALCADSPAVAASPGETARGPASAVASPRVVLWSPR